MAVYVVGKREIDQSKHLNGKYTGVWNFKVKNFETWATFKMTVISESDCFTFCKGNFNFSGGCQSDTFLTAALAQASN